MVMLWLIFTIFAGHSFDMRGKKFLDAMVYESTSKAQTTAATAGGGINSPIGKTSSTTAAAAGALSPEESSTLLASSIFGFGFLGGTAQASTDNYTRPTITAAKKTKSKTLEEIFFVQSNALFLLVEPRDDGQ